MKPLAQGKTSSSRKKPSDYLEDQLKKKELEYNFIKEVFSKDSAVNINKNTLEDLNIASFNSKPKQKIINPNEMLEKIEKDKIRREEKEKLKMLEKLEAQVLGKKPKLNSLNLTNTSSSMQSERANPKRLIDNLNLVKGENSGSTMRKVETFDKKILDDSEFRKTIKKEKIEINCEKSIDLKIEADKDDQLDKDFLSNLSAEKRKFFLFKTRELYDFLKSIKLIRYIETFMEDGIEDLECILDIDEDYFQERKYPPNHQKRILNKIIELKANQNILENQPENELEVKPIMPISSSGPNEEFGTDPINDSILPANKKRSCCWNCLKIILEESCLVKIYEEKVMKNKVTFCSKLCCDNYNLKVYTNCNKCGIKMEKGNGKYINEFWFCNENCIEEYMKENINEILGEEVCKVQINDSLEENDENFEEIEDEKNDENEYDPMLDF